MSLTREERIAGARCALAYLPGWGSSFFHSVEKEVDTADEAADVLATREMPAEYG